MSMKTLFTALLLSFAFLSCAKIDDFEVPECTDDAVQSQEMYDSPNIKLLVDGSEYVDSLLSLIDNARHTIYLEMYEFRSDSVGSIVMSHLIEKAREGVGVQLILDGWGSRGQWLGDALTGIRLQECDSFRFPYVNHILSRNHRKVVIVDGNKYMVGCTNIADYYVDGLPELGDWHDMTLMFVKNPSFEESSQILRGRSEIIDKWIWLIDNAKEKVNIINPYIAPPAELEDAILGAISRGVKVTFIFGEKGDINSYLRSSRSFLSRIGALVWIYPQGFHHTKAMSVDGKSLFIGSANMTRRALKRNLEENVLVTDRVVVEKFDSLFSLYTTESYEMNYDSVSLMDRLYDYFSFMIID